MTMQKGQVFDFELFEHKQAGGLCAIVTHRDGLDVAYIHPNGRVQWAVEMEYLNENEISEVERMCIEIAQCNYAV